MLVKFKRQVRLSNGKFVFTPGTKEVSDEIANDWYFKSLVNDGSILVLDEPKPVLPAPPVVEPPPPQAPPVVPVEPPVVPAEPAKKSKKSEAK